MKRIKELYKKNVEIINYLIFGVLGTIVSLSVYFICVHTFLNAYIGWQLQLANCIIFAFITNKLFVFKSDSDKVFKEATLFLIVRIITLLLDVLIMYVFVTRLAFNDSIIKVISQAAVIISNYVFSKLIVFKKAQNKI